MILDEKIDAARRLISESALSHGNPVAMSSFGKDSMVLLHLLESEGLRLPILFHREPAAAAKYAFANRIIEDRGYSVFDYPPLTTAFTKKGTHAAIVSLYQVNAGHNYVPNTIVEPESDKPFLCGLRDLYLKPRGTFEFPWDLVFIGHKSTDHDAIWGAVPLRADTRSKEGVCNYAFPLRHFTDADIWEYTRRFALPFNARRYDEANGFREREDLSANDDKHYACTRCMDRDLPARVFCPKWNQEMENLSDTIAFLEPQVPEYIGTGN